MHSICDMALNKAHEYCSSQYDSFILYYISEEIKLFRKIYILIYFSKTLRNDSEGI